jgi:hypothetical protein
MGPKLLKGTHLYYVAAAKEEHTPTTLKSLGKEEKVKDIVIPHFPCKEEY